MSLLPVLTPEHALFLDFDGTLTELAAHPDAVRIAPGLVPTLATLHSQLGGALALVTGRRESDIDGFLAPLQLPVASEHGAQLRLADGTRQAVPAPDLAPVLDAAMRLAGLHQGLLVEPKRASVALHYRLAPQLETLCRDTLVAAVHTLEGVELLQGKCVFEVKPLGVNKGQAISMFMSSAPFEGRIPVFAGDDVTDEAGFASVQALGGHGIKVGEGQTLAHQRCQSPATFRGWLAASRSALPAGQ